MSIPLVIQDFRLSFVWTEMLLDVIGGSVQPTAAFAFLAQGDLYKNTFESVQLGQHPLGLEPPWPRAKSQRFWKRYLPGAVLDSVGGRQAWQYLVPFRAKPPLNVKSWRKGQLSLEGFYYPHGLAFAITARCSGPLSMDEVLKLAYAIRHSEKFAVQTNGTTRQLGLGALAQEGLDSLRQNVLGPSVMGPRRERFTVFSVVRAEGDSLATNVANNPNIHRALESITNWPPDPAAITLPPLSDVACLPLKSDSAKSSVLYVRQRGRALWFPGLFTSQNRISSLACYHRNHLLGSMQVDSLGSVVAGTAASLRNGTALSALAGWHRACAQNACDCLERIHAGDKRLTYRSQSLKKQIQENDLADLNELRRAFVPGAVVLT